MIEIKVKKHDFLPRTASKFGLLHIDANFKFVSNFWALQYLLNALLVTKLLYNLKECSHLIAT